MKAPAVATVRSSTFHIFSVGEGARPSHIRELCMGLCVCVLTTSQSMGSGRCSFLQGVVSWVGLHILIGLHLPSPSLFEHSRKTLQSLQSSQPHPSLKRPHDAHGVEPLV